MLDKKQIWVIFLPEFKWVVKQQRQLATSTTHLAQELLMNVQCSAGSRSFAKKQEPWRWGRGGWPLEVDNDQLRAIVETDPLTTTREVAEELNIDCFTVIWHLKQIGKVKRLNKWVPHEMTESQKRNHRFEVLSSLFLCSNCGQFLNWIVACDEKWILYNI